jgi:hypothetical protein
MNGSTHAKFRRQQNRKRQSLAGIKVSLLRAWESRVESSESAVCSGAEARRPRPVAPLSVYLGRLALWPPPPEVCAGTDWRSVAGRRIPVAFQFPRLGLVGWWAGGLVGGQGRELDRRQGKEMDGRRATAGSVGSGGLGLRRLGVGGGAVLGWVAQRSGACLLGGGKRKAESGIAGCACLAGVVYAVLCCAVPCCAVLLIPTYLPTYSLYRATLRCLDGTIPYDAPGPRQYDTTRHDPTRHETSTAHTTPTRQTNQAHTRRAEPDARQASFRPNHRTSPSTAALPSHRPTIRRIRRSPWTSKTA